MTKELRIIFEALNGKKDQVKALLAENKVVDAEAMMDEVRNLQKKADLQTEIDAQAALELPVELPKAKENKIEYKDVFFKAFKGKKLTEEEASLLNTQAALSSTSGTDGGFIIPQDIQTRIMELKRDLPLLENYVNVEPVSTLTGSRVIEKYADIVPFATFAEGSDVPAASTPQFLPIAYTIVDKGGILPVPNNLMNDTDQNLMAYLEKWLLRKSIATRNAMIVAKLKTLSPVPIVDFDGIKKAINVTLDPMLAAGAIVATNQDGFNYLDTLKDGDGEYVLKSDVTVASGKLLAGKPVVVVTNKQLPTVATLAPIFMGDLKEFCTIFDRQQMSVLATQFGGTSFQNNRTDIRAIVRDDIEIADSSAVVYGQITIV
ncbi:MAG TPA: phage major capsid protein [Clostridiaceae bacterium]